MLDVNAIALVTGIVLIVLGIQGLARALEGLFTLSQERRRREAWRKAAEGTGAFRRAPRSR